MGSKRIPVAYAIGNVVTWSSVIVDPIIYIVTQRKYRSAIKRMFPNFCQSNNMHQRRIDSIDSRLESYRINENSVLNTLQQLEMAQYISTATCPTDSSIPISSIEISSSI